MKVLSLFAGIGGIDLGLSRCGMTTVQFVEYDAACQHWLAANFPGVPIHGDIHTFNATRFRGIDLVVGGFPCQPFSVAGKQKGQDDPRHLWPQMARVIRESCPRWVLAENVPGLRTIAADLVLKDLEELGYTTWPLVVGAVDVGASHRRKRVWIVARYGLADADSSRIDADELRRGEWPSGAGASDARGGREAVAHRDGGGCWEERIGGILDGKREARGNDVDGRGERAVGEILADSNNGRSREDQLRSQLRSTRSVESSSSSRVFGVSSEVGEVPRWPARPGEPQHAWEAPRLAKSGMGDTTDGIPRWVAGYTSAHRREALKALGNAVVPQVVEVIGHTILYMDQRIARLNAIQKIIPERC